MQPEEAVEIDGGIGAASRPLNRERRARRVVVALAERHDHVQAVHGAALEDRDEDALPRAAGCRRGAREKLRREPEADEREPPVLQEDPS